MARTSSSTAGTRRRTGRSCGTSSGYPHVDVGGGWLIFKLPPAEVAVHPAGEHELHELYLMCDDVEATVAELAAKGVELADPITDQGWGVLTTIRLPGGGQLGLYEPRHQTAYDL